MNMVVLSIKNGKIKGKICQDIDGKTFYSFQGIPYAKPPLGSLRFKAPQPAESWSDIKDCTEEGNECMSKHILARQIVGSEDCLNLNVYTPKIPDGDSPNSLKPVMFWIHGGVFINGSNKTELYGPEVLVSEDVVLVVINYRLGYFGFLSLDDSSLGVPGNAGLKDMVMALKWVQNNIIYFNGDPNNVTVFGESAGAVGAHLLMLSPMSKGLLHKVIAQSCCAISSWSVGSRSARRIAAELGFHNSDDRKLLPFLQSVPAVDLVKMQVKFDANDFVEQSLRTLGVVIERESNEEAFLTQHPIEIILSGNYHHVPMIIGYNWEEGMAYDVLAPPAARQRSFNNRELALPIPLNIKRGSPISTKLGEVITKFYYRDEGKNITREKYIRNYYTVCTDTCFLRDIYFSVKAHQRTALKPIYFYRLSLETELNLYKNLARFKVPGVCHGDDLGYLFKTAFTPDLEPDSVADIGRKRIKKLWANFAKYGNPTPDPTDKLLNIQWKAIDKKDIHFLDIGEELRMDVNPENERMQFWTNIYKINPIISKI